MFGHLGAMVRARAIQNESVVLRSLLEVGESMSALTDRQQVLELVLREARRLAIAEAGTLYVLRENRLKFVAVQNDRLDISQVSRGLLGHELPVSGESLAGFVAMTGLAMNIEDTYSLPAGTSFRIDREFDAALRYSTRSVLAMPLICPGGPCVGVLEFINHIDSAGNVGPFPAEGIAGLESLAAMAAVTVYNHLLQDQLRQAHLDTIMRLAVAAEFRDDDTGEHVRRISRSSAMIARRMGLGESQVELLQWASPMHDIGKIGIPDSILLKPGRLTDDERLVVQRHPQIGADILSDPQNELIAVAREVALSHHERWDGQGYPDRLAGTAIPLSGRIVCLADVLDALISKRCYKAAYPLDKVMGIIRDGRGSQFDPDVVDAFTDISPDVVEPYLRPAAD